MKHLLLKYVNNLIKIAIVNYGNFKLNQDFSKITWAIILIDVPILLHHYTGALERLRITNGF